MNLFTLLVQRVLRYLGYLTSKVTRVASSMLTPPLATQVMVDTQISVTRHLVLFTTRYHSCQWYHRQIVLILLVMTGTANIFQNHLKLHMNFSYSRQLQQLLDQMFRLLLRYHNLSKVVLRLLVARLGSHHSQLIPARDQAVPHQGSVAFKVNYPCFHWYPGGYQADYSSCYKTWKSEGVITDCSHWYPCDYRDGYSSCYETWESAGVITNCYWYCFQVTTICSRSSTIRLPQSTTVGLQTAGTRVLFASGTSSYFDWTIVITGTKGTDTAGTDQGAYPQDTGDTNAVTGAETATGYLGFLDIGYHAG